MQCLPAFMGKSPEFHRVIRHRKDRVMSESSPISPANLLLPTETLATTMDFDQYARYLAVARVAVAMLADAPRPVSIVEVGGNTLTRLLQFLNSDLIRVMRCDVLDLPRAYDYVLVERGKPLLFADNAFDLTVSLEVIEHVVPDERELFVRECLRVGRYGAIFTCPNGCPAVEQAEHLVHETYRLRHGVPHPFLAEHAAYGLPREADVCRLLRACGVTPLVLDNSPLDAWLGAVVLTEQLVERDEFRTIVPWVNYTLRHNAHDCAIPYRKIYACSKRSGILQDVAPAGTHRPDQASGEFDLTGALQQFVSLAASTLVNLDEQWQPRLLSRGWWIALRPGGPTGVQHRSCL